MAAWGTQFATRIVSRRALCGFLLVAALGIGWGLQHASAELVERGLAPFGSLFTIHVLLTLTFIATLSLRCELFLPNIAELAFFCLGGLLAALLSLTVAATATAQIPAASVLAAASGLSEQTGFGEQAWPWIIVALALAIALYAGLLAIRWPHRLNSLQVMTGVVLAASAAIAPLAGQEGEFFILTGRFKNTDMVMGLVTGIMGIAYYLLVLATQTNRAVFRQRIGQ